MISRSAATTLFAMSNSKGNAYQLFNIFNVHNQRLRLRPGLSLPIQILLTLVAKNSVDKSKQMIDQDASLLLEADDVLTSNGWHIECVTPLELALCCGSTEMVEMMESYFGLFDGGIEELRAIYAKYHPQISSMLTVTEHTNIISSLVQVINNSSKEQLIAVLNDDMSADNPLNNSLNSHKQHAKNARRVDATLFFPYQYLLQAFDYYDANFDDTFVNDMHIERRCIFSMHVIGPLLCQLPISDQSKFEEFILPNGKEKVNNNQFYYLKRVNSFGELKSPTKITLATYITNKQTKLLAITKPERHIEIQTRKVQANEKKMLPADLRHRCGQLK